MDYDLALFAARSIAHGRTDDLFRSGKYAELVNCLDLDDKNIESLLLDVEKPLVGKYERLICLYGDYCIRKDSAGNWKNAKPLKSLRRRFRIRSSHIASRLSFRA